MIIGSAVVGWCSRVETPPQGVDMLCGTVMHPDAAAGFDIHGRDLDLKFVGYRFGQIQYLSEEFKVFDGYRAQRAIDQRNIENCFAQIG